MGSISQLNELEVNEDRIERKHVHRQFTMAV